MNRLVVATSNQNKFSEIIAEIQQAGFAVNSLLDFPGVPESPETGNTFEENAIQKAEFYYGHLHRPVLAEDSGLVIQALKGFPGIHSARVAADDPARIRLILEKLRDCTDRTATYVCSMVLKTQQQVHVVEGRCDGVITESPRGNYGFGYDPIFQPEGSNRTFAQMSRQEKSLYSHRGRAARKMIPHLIDSLATTD